MSVIHDNLIRLEDEARMPQFIEKRNSQTNDLGIFTFDLPKEIINDFHDLRGQICIANARKNTKVFAITSSVPGEGSSTITTNLGFLMAGGLTRRMNLETKDDETKGPESIKDGKDDNMNTYFTSDFRSVLRNGSFKPALNVMQATNTFGSEGENTAGSSRVLAGGGVEHRNEVLLVDANMQHPSLHRYFGLEQGPGLAEILEQDVEWWRAVHLVKESDLCVITSGTNDANPAELLASAKMRKVVQTLRSEFNYIIFDSPPVLTSVDAVSLASVVDGVILIIRAGQTRWEVAQHAKHKLLAAEANLLGVALNRRKANIPDGFYQRLVG